MSIEKGVMRRSNSACNWNLAAIPSCDYAPGSNTKLIATKNSVYAPDMSDDHTHNDETEASSNPDAVEATSKPKKTMSKVPFIVTFMAVGIMTLVFLTGISGGRYSLEIQNVVENQGEYTNKEIKVVGRIKDGWREENGTTIFVIHDDAGREITVSYAHNRPDPFKEGRKCIVEGKLRADGVIECTKLTVKCPSKYQSENDLAGGTEGSYDKSGSSP